MDQSSPWRGGAPRQPENIEILPPERDAAAEDPRVAPIRGRTDRRIWIAFGPGDGRRILLQRPSPLAMLAFWLVVGGLAVAGLFVLFWTLVVGAIAAGAVLLALLASRLLAGLGNVRH